MLKRAHSAQPERGIETGLARRLRYDDRVLIQHNPNEGLKLLILLTACAITRSAHSAQPERGIET